MDWLNQIFAKILSIFPTRSIIAPHERGIRITFGNRVRVLEPGWYLWWPIIQEIIFAEIVPQVVDLRTQSVKTKDGKNVIVGGGIQYRIINIKNAILNVQDFDKALETLALGIILEFVAKRTLEDCEDIETLKAEILDGVKNAAGSWGLKIQRIFVTDFGDARNFRLLKEREV